MGFTGPANGTLTLTLAIPLPTGQPRIIGSQHNGKNSTKHGSDDDSDDEDDDDFFDADWLDNGASNVVDSKKGSITVLLAGLVALGAYLF